MTDETVQEPVRNLGYLCFSRNTPEEEAAARFAARFGLSPEYMFEYKRLLWVGPIPKKGSGSDE